MCCCRCECRRTEPLKVGDRIQHKRIVNGVRLGGKETKRIVYLSDNYAIYTVHTSDGRFLDEIWMIRAEFNDEMERADVL
jgi:hypothetical protein